MDAISERADLAERNLMLCIRQRDAAQTEADSLRRQLIGISGMAIDTISDAINTDLIYENIILRRQLEECKNRCKRMESFCAVHGVKVQP